MTRRKPTRAKQLGIDDDAYTTLLQAQDGRCALCPSTPKTRRLNVDHDHRSLAIRGLLCHRCNRALPVWITPAWLRNAADYLDNHTGPPAPPLPARPSYTEKPLPDYPAEGPTVADAAYWKPGTPTLRRGPP